MNEGESVVVAIWPRENGGRGSLKAGKRGHNICMRSIGMTGESVSKHGPETDNVRTSQSISRELG